MPVGPSRVYSGHNNDWMNNAGGLNQHPIVPVHSMENPLGLQRFLQFLKLGANKIPTHEAAIISILTQQQPSQSSTPTNFAFSIQSPITHPHGIRSFNVDWMGPSSAANEFTQGSMFTRYSNGMNQYHWMTAPFNGVPGNPMASALSPRPFHNPLSGAPLGYNPIFPPQSMNFGPNMAGRPGPVYQRINPAQYPGMVPQSVLDAGIFHQPWVESPQNAYSMV
ncbi:hypothetical protein RUND412_010813 [Rhizina undulata]